MRRASSQWAEIGDASRDIARAYSRKFWDTRARRRLEPGELLWAAAFGPEWDVTWQYRESNCSDPPPPQLLDAARRLRYDGLPSWAQQAPERGYPAPSEPED